jgi:3'-phosphoadenosine 5'-phosphosulfate sulfotransferase (PAPS reductase)/FAD synthetase
MQGSGYKFNIRDKKSELENPKEHRMVVAFSGGRTSGMMLRYLLDTEKNCPLVLFANTGKERDETLDFVHEVETRWQVPVVWLELTHVPVNPEYVKKHPSPQTRSRLIKQEKMLWYKEVKYETASRHTDDVTPFDTIIDQRAVLPNAVSRYCSSELKVRTMQRYLWDKQVDTFRNAIGFRADEPDRAYDLIYSGDRNKKCYIEFPLMKAGIRVEDVMAFWKKQPFDLKLEPHEGNCHLCFLKKRRSLLALINAYPKLSEWWSDKERNKKSKCHGDGSKFNRNFTIEQLIEESFNYEPISEDKTDAMQCACTTSMSLAELEQEP